MTVGLSWRLKQNVMMVSHSSTSTQNRRSRTIKVPGGIYGTAVKLVLTCSNLNPKILQPAEKEGNNICPTRLVPRTAPRCGLSSPFPLSIQTADELPKKYRYMKKLWIAMYCMNWYTFHVWRFWSKCYFDAQVNCWRGMWPLKSYEGMCMGKAENTYKFRQKGA